MPGFSALKVVRFLHWRRGYQPRDAIRPRSPKPNAARMRIPLKAARTTPFSISNLPTTPALSLATPHFAPSGGIFFQRGKNGGFWKTLANLRQAGMEPTAASPLKPAISILSYRFNTTRVWRAGVRPAANSSCFSRFSRMRCVATCAPRIAAPARSGLNLPTPEDGFSREACRMFSRSNRSVRFLISILSAFARGWNLSSRPICP